MQQQAKIQAPGAHQTTKHCPPWAATTVSLDPWANAAATSTQSAQANVAVVVAAAQESAKTQAVTTLKRLSVANLGFAVGAAPLLQYITAARPRAARPGRSVHAKL